MVCRRSVSILMARSTKVSSCPWPIFTINFEKTDICTFYSIKSQLKTFDSVTIVRRVAIQTVLTDGLLSLSKLISRDNLKIYACRPKVVVRCILRFYAIWIVRSSFREAHKTFTCGQTVQNEFPAFHVN